MSLWPGGPTAWELEEQALYSEDVQVSDAEVSRSRRHGGKVTVHARLSAEAYNRLDSASIATGLSKAQLLNQLLLGLVSMSAEVEK